MQPFFLSVINEIMEDKIQFSTPDLHLKLAASIAKRITFKPEKNISEPELSQLLETLFQNEDPEIGVTGNPVFFRITKADLEKRFTHA
jgi:DNA mismatch repair ATPase MutL